MGKEMKFTVGKTKYYVWFEDDLNDRLVYTDNFGSHFYKINGQVVYFSNDEEEKFRELRRKHG
jgi:hypothetical protein